MRNRFMGTVATLLAGGSLALAQPSPSDSAPLADQAQIAEEAAPVEESEMAEPTEMAGQPEKSETLNIRPRAVTSDLPRVVTSEPSSPSDSEVVVNGPVEEGPAELSGPACEGSACCPSGGAPCCDSNCRFYGSVEALFWWIKDSNVSTGTNLRIVDSSKVDNEDRVGGRFTAGYWVDDYRTFAVEATYLFLGSRSVEGNTGPTSLRIVNTEVTVPGRERTLSSRLEGWEANVRAHALDDSPFGVDLIAGFRNLQVNEGLGIRLGQAVGGVPGVGIGASNDFFGGQVGACRATATVPCRWMSWARLPWVAPTKTWTSTSVACRCPPTAATTASPRSPKPTSSSAMPSPTTSVPPWATPSFTTATWFGPEIR